MNRRATKTRPRRSLEGLVLDKKLVAALGGADGVVGILRALADAIGKKKRKKRRPA